MGRLRTISSLLLRTAVVPLFTILAGCIMIWPFRERDSRGLVVSFSHKTHVEEEGLPCEGCHNTFAREDHAGMPKGLRGCFLCHEEIDAEKPQERGVEVYLDAAGEPRWSRVTVLPEEVRFSHRAHHEAEIPCGECHRRIEQNVAANSTLAMRKDDCYGCHRDRADKCAYCHQDIRADRAPADHRHGWMRQHGTVVRTALDERNSERCGLCHEKRDCESCHQAMEPRNHTNQWRLRVHGIAAAIDRERCWTCHRVDLCQRCHEETRPRSHRATFGSPLNRHCLECHLPVSSENCTTCHRGSPSHFEVPDMPSGHTPRQDCRACHIGLGHPDNGQSCTLCHTF